MPHEEQPTTSRGVRWTAMLVVLIGAAGLRCGVLAARWDRLSRDDDAYRLIAENLHRHAIYTRAAPAAAPQPTAFRPPLYPLTLAAVAWHGQVTPVSVAILHMVLGLATVALVFRLAQACGLGPWSWLAATLVACDPILLNQTAEVMTETMATFLAAAGLGTLSFGSPALGWKRAILAGLAVGLATLCRPTFLVWAALCAAFLFLRAGRGARLARAGVFGAGCLLVLMPWTVRNYFALGKPVWATTHGGYTLLLGNNPRFYDHLSNRPWGEVWDAKQMLPLLNRPAERPKESGNEHAELESDRRLYQLALATIRQNPKMFVYASVIRVGRFWRPLPHQLSPTESNRRKGLRWLIALWYGAVFLAAWVGLWCQRTHLVRVPWVWGLLLVAAFTLVHAVYWSNLRMRAPVMPVVCLAAAAGCACIWRNSSWHRQQMARG